MNSTRRAGEEGFALTVALLALVGLTALATAGFLVADADLKVTQNHRSSVEAFYAAHAAQSEFLALNGIPEPQIDYEYDDADATVRSTPLLELPNGLRLYRVSAAATLSDPRGGAAARRVNEVAMYTPYPLKVTGAFTALNGLKKNGQAGTIEGYDAAPSGPCAAGYGNGGEVDVAGVAVPPGGYTQNGGTSVPTGDPPIHEAESSEALSDSTGIEWSGLVSEDMVQPHYRIPEDAWPDFSTLPADEWPVIHVTSSYFELTPSHTGQGTIILDGDFALNGNFQWKGLILAGGRLVSDGQQKIDGAVFSGLNQQLGHVVGESDVGNGNKIFRYQSCNVRAAAQAMGWLTTKRGSWYETI